MVDGTINSSYENDQAAFPFMCKILSKAQFRGAKMVVRFRQTGNVCELLSALETCPCVCFFKKKTHNPFLVSIEQSHFS